MQETSRVSLQDLAKKVFANPVGEYTHRDYPEQIRLVGMVGGKFYTLVFEEIEVILATTNT